MNKVQTPPQLPIMMLAVLATVSGCERGPDAGAAAPIPENRMVTARGEHLDRGLREAADHFLESHPVLEYVPAAEAAVALGNMVTARRMLENRDLSEGNPVAIYATWGLDMMGEPYATVWAINPRREAVALHVTAVCGDGAVATLQRRFDLKEKDLDVINQCYVRAELSDWQHVEPMYPAGASAGDPIVITDGKAMPIPTDCALAFALEDRTAGLSNFVPAVRWDYRSNKRATTNNEDGAPQVRPPG